MKVEASYEGVNAMNAPTMPPPLAHLRSAPLLGPTSSGLSMSREEFEAIEYDDCEPGYRYELINGVVVVSPPPGDAGQGPNELLGHWLWDYQQRHPNGKILDISMMERAVRTKVGIRVVDRAIWLGFGRVIQSKRDLPTIIVEFVSAGKRAWVRDYEEKRVEYQALGAKEYWVIDRFRRTMTVYYQAPVDPAERVVNENEIYTTPLLPGFELPLKQLLQLADQYADED
jgi:Uma2 family endonuclease